MADKFLRILLIASLVVVVYVPLYLIGQNGSERSAYVYRPIFPWALLVLAVTAMFTIQKHRRFSVVPLSSGPWPDWFTMVFRVLHRPLSPPMRITPHLLLLCLA